MLIEALLVATLDVGHDRAICGCVGSKRFAAFVLPHFPKGTRPARFHSLCCGARACKSVGGSKVVPAKLRNFRGVGAVQKLVWRVMLVADNGAGSAREIEVARIEREDHAVPQGLPHFACWFPCVVA